MSARSAILVTAVLTACEPSKPSASSASPELPTPSASSAPSAVRGTETGLADVGETCFESMVRTLDGGPTLARRCKAGLVCDYTGAVPDGPGRCKKSP